MYAGGTCGGGGLEFIGEMGAGGGGGGGVRTESSPSTGERCGILGKAGSGASINTSLKVTGTAAKRNGSNGPSRPS